MFLRNYNFRFSGRITGLFILSTLLSDLAELKAQTETTTRFLTLDELFQAGVENSLQIKSSQLNTRIAGENEKTARGAYLPDIYAGFSGGYVGQPTVYTQGLSGAQHPETPDWMQSYTLEITQPLYQGGRIRYNTEKSALEKQIASLNTDRDKAEIKIVLLSRYLDLLKLYKQREVLARNIKESEQQLHDIRQMRKQEMITQNDVIRSELQLTNYKLAFRETQNNILIISQQLDMALGLDENLLIQPDTSLLLVAHPLSSFGTYIQLAYSNYPELKMVQADILVAQKEMQLTKTTDLPSLSLQAAEKLGRPVATTSPVKDLFMNSWNISLTLSYRLSSLYHNKHNINAARQVIELQQTQEELQKQEIRTHVKASYIKHGEALDRISALTTYLQQANENYRIVRNKYLNQLAILTDLLDAGSVRLDAELQLTTAQSNAVYTWYQLQRESGGI